MSELLPCPFCGGAAFLDIVKNKFDCLEGSIACNCGARGEDIENIADGYATDQEAISHITTLWNTRPPVQDDEQAFQDMMDLIEKYTKVPNVDAVVVARLVSSHYRLQPKEIEG